MSFKKNKTMSPLLILLAVTLCGKISANQGINCDQPLQSGTEDTLILLNWEDWLDAALTLNGTDDQIVENIILASGITGYEMLGKNNSNNPQAEMIKQEYTEMWNHELNYKVFNVNAAAKKQMRLKTKGRFVAIVYNKYKGLAGDSAFEIYGGDSGLIVTQMKRVVNDTATQGAWDIILKTDEKSLEPFPPKTLYKTSYAVTKAIAESLVA